VNFKNFEIHPDFICLPAVRPGCARCTAPEISDFQGNDSRLTNVLFQLRSIHCIMLFALKNGFFFLQSS